MGNPDKRKKRAKQKSKLVNVKKQEALNQRNKEKVIQITPDMMSFFETLPPFNPEHDAVPEIKRHVLSTNKSVHNLEMSVAILYIIYGHWQAPESDELLYAEVLSIADRLVMEPKFVAKFNVDEICSTDQ